MQTTTLFVPDISCEHCANKIKKALGALDVSNVQVDIANKKVTLGYPDEATLALVVAKLDDIGYPVQQ